MKRLVMMAALSVALGTWACGGSGGDDRTAVSAPTAEAGRQISTTVEGATTGDNGTVAHPPASVRTKPASTGRERTPADSRPSTTTTPANTADREPRLQISVYARAGETPPGRVQPLDAPAWKVTGSGWHEGDVALVIRRAGDAGVVMTAGGRADASGRWEQTFVLPITASPGSYVAVASQGRHSAQVNFELEPSPAGPEVVDRGSAPAGEWQLLAEREPSGVLCAALKVDGRGQGHVCSEPSEQDFNGDDVLRYAGAGDGTFVVGVGASGVERVRVELRDGTIVERGTVGASFAGSRFVALPLPANSVISTLVALGSNDRVLTRFALNP